VTDINRRELFLASAALALFSAPLPPDVLGAIRDAVASVFPRCRVEMATEDPACDDRWWAVHIYVDKRRFSMAGGFDKLDSVPLARLTSEAREAAERLKGRLVGGTWHSPISPTEKALLA
jgi:hypothetical protein